MIQVIFITVHGLISKADTICIQNKKCSTKVKEANYTADIVAYARINNWTLWILLRTQFLEWQ